MTYDADMPAVAALSDDEVAAVKARGPLTGAALTAQYDVPADDDG